MVYVGDVSSQRSVCYCSFTVRENCIFYKSGADHLFHQLLFQRLVKRSVLKCNQTKWYVQKCPHQNHQSFEFE